VERRAYETIGARLKRLRLERGLSQRQLAGPGVSYAYISRIEADTRTPSVKALRVLAPKLGVSVEYLEEGRDGTAAEERDLRLADAELRLRLDEDSAEAERVLRAVLEDAEEAGDATAAARARLGLGLAAAQDGRYLDAVELLEPALEEAIATPIAQPDVYGTLGQAYASLGAPDRAVQLFDRCVDEVERKAPDDTHAQVRYATYLSYALTDAGDYERARNVVRDALHRAEGGPDPYTRVRLYWSLARLAGLSGRPREALAQIRRAIALLEATEDTAYLARAHMLAAGVELTEGDVPAAKEHVDQAERLAGPTAGASDVGMLKIVHGRIALAEGDAPRAADLARGALAAFGDFHGGEQGDAVWVLAQALARQEGADGARAAYRRAIDLLALHGRQHEAATAAGEWADVLERHGRADEAARLRDEAARLTAAVTGATPAGSRS
jgi:transcriptional regulator with XRE-family HTH domain